MVLGPFTDPGGLKERSLQNDLKKRIWEPTESYAHVQLDPVAAEFAFHLHFQAHTHINAPTHTHSHTRSPTHIHSAFLCRVEQWTCKWCGVIKKHFPRSTWLLLVLVEPSNKNQAG